MQAEVLREPTMYCLAPFVGRTGSIATTVNRVGRLATIGGRQSLRGVFAELMPIQVAARMGGQKRPEFREKMRISAARNRYARRG